MHVQALSIMSWVRCNAEFHIVCKECVYIACESNINCVLGSAMTQPSEDLSLAAASSSCIATRSRNRNPWAGQINWVVT